LTFQDKYIDPTGTYDLESETRKDGGDIYGYFGQIQVKRLTEKQIVMTFMVNKGAPSYNSGSFVDTLAYKDNNAIYTAPGFDPSCKISFDFTENGVTVKEETDNYNFGCGFGHAVVADGFFKRTSSNEPELRHPMTDEKIEK
tara:strand:- start:352 stop:777 length:426 start_codon:yes stop_codon:yes gene_type:complete